MPDQSDVEAALAAAANDALYPGGTGAMPAAGVLCRVFRGFPAAPALGADLSAGQVDVSVTVVEGSYRNTTRYLPGLVCEPAAPLLSAVTSGATVTLSGRADAGQLAGVLVDDAAHVYRTSAGDTPEVVAAALAALVRVDRPAVLWGATMSFPGAMRVVSRTVADTPDTVELRRQTQEFRVTVWAPTPALRDVVSAVLDAGLADTRFLQAGGSACRMLSSGSSTSDVSGAAGLYRRDLLMTVEYPTTATIERPAMLFGKLVADGRTNLC